MSEVLTLPGRGNTYFYFTRIGGDGFSDRQQSLIRELIRSYRLRYPELEINGVWDFGMEEGSPYEGEKYGDFASCRDHAVFNNATLSISFSEYFSRSSFRTTASLSACMGDEVTNTPAFSPS